jgi:hypothetical protein
MQCISFLFRASNTNLNSVLPCDNMGQRAVKASEGTCESSAIYSDIDMALGQLLLRRDKSFLQRSDES